MMNVMISCVICHNSDHKLRFFHAPRNPVRLKKWSESLNGLEITTSSIICEKHFLAEHFTKNSELNCWRLNSKAMPTLHLTDEEFGDYTLINKEFLDNDCTMHCKLNSKNVSTQTNFANTNLKDLVYCLWCDELFPTHDMYEFIKHIGSQHRSEIESFFDYIDEEISKQQMVENMDTDTETVEFKVATDIQRSNEYCVENYEMETKSVTNFSEDDAEFFEKEDFDHVIKNENETSTNPNISDDSSSGETIKLETNSDFSGIAVAKQDRNEMESSHEMLPSVAKNNNSLLNFETSDESIVFYLIELLQTYPALWFINLYKSEEYEAALISMFTQISEKYANFMSEIVLHEGLIEIRDWYQKMFQEENFKKLVWPQSEYYEKLAAFLPDSPNGKTCVPCQRLFNDHVQYFAHKHLEHATELPNEKDSDAKKPEEISLIYLRKNVNDYFSARYPLRVGGFSYQCQICAKKYGRTCKRSFLDHIKTHLNIRDHVCDICGKTFIRLEKFSVHRKRHFGLYKGVCQICGKEFTSFSNLTIHRRRYHRPIEGTIEEIEKHRINRGLKPSEKYKPVTVGDSTVYACLVCDRKYKYKKNALVHYKRAHKIKKSVTEEEEQIAITMIEIMNETESDL